MTHTPSTLLEAVRFFKKPENCKEFMVSRRWPDGVVCPRCGSSSVYFVESRNGWECKTKHPKRTFSLKTGTIFEDSALGLDKWLPCVWLIANAKNGISSHEIARALGVTQKTAWFMLQRIRLAMQDEDNGGKMSGDVEMDETYIGGKALNMHAAKAVH
jgi:transposase-like protein